MTVAPLEKIPQGKVKILNIADITWDKRYRVELGDMNALTESIREKGVIQPITVDTNLRLLAGERRITAAGLAGLAKIPALVRETDGEIDAREIELIENIARKDFTWDERARLVRDIDLLCKEKNQDWSGRKTAALLDKGVASVSRDITLANAMDVVPELADMKTADDALKTIKGLEEKAIVHELRNRQRDPENTGLSGGVGDALELADRCYQLGDAFKGIAELASNGRIGMIECDPPYGIELNKVKASKDSAVNNVDSYNEIPTKEYESFLRDLTKELFRVASANCWMVFWYGPSWHTEVFKCLNDAGWMIDEIPCIWVKNQGQTLQPELYLARAYEPFFLCRKGHPVMMKRGRLNVFLYNGVSPTQKYHPTERPVELIEDILETLAPPGTRVLVPFLGSGATIRAGFNLGLNVHGWELNSEYKDKFMLKIEEDSRTMLSLTKE